MLVLVYSAALRAYSLLFYAFIKLARKPYSRNKPNIYLTNHLLSFLLLQISQNKSMHLVIKLLVAVSSSLRGGFVAAAPEWGGGGGIQGEEVSSYLVYLP